MPAPLQKNFPDVLLTYSRAEFGDTFPVISVSHKTRSNFSTPSWVLNSRYRDPRSAETQSFPVSSRFTARIRWAPPKNSLLLVVRIKASLCDATNLENRYRYPARVNPRLYPFQLTSCVFLSGCLFQSSVIATISEAQLYCALSSQREIQPCSPFIPGFWNPFFRHNL